MKFMDFVVAVWALCVFVYILFTKVEEEEKKNGGKDK